MLCFGEAFGVTARDIVTYFSPVLPDIPTSFENMSPSRGTAGATHLAAAIPNLAYASNPAGPGLGVELDEGKLIALHGALTVVP